MHYEEVLKFKASLKGAWPPAKRYDITHRMNVWAFRLADGSMADVGIFNKDLAAECLVFSKSLEDHCYVENPYAHGMALQHTSPYNGQVYPASASWDSNLNPMTYNPSSTLAMMKNHVAAPAPVPFASGSNNKSIAPNSNSSSHAQSRPSSYVPNPAPQNNSFKNLNNYNNSSSSSYPVQQQFGPVYKNQGYQGSGSGYDSYGQNGQTGYEGQASNPWDGTDPRPKIGLGSFVPKNKSNKKNGGDRSQK